MKTMSAAEIESRNMLEKILRLCVEDVKTEIAKKRSENKSSYYARGKRGKLELREERNLSAIDRTKIIEVLASQERVLTLLYDRTFPPKQQSTATPGQYGTSFNMALGRTMSADQRLDVSSMGSMGAFNQNHNALNGRNDLAMEEDVELLEREIDSVLRRTQLGSAFKSKRGIELPIRDHRDVGPRMQTAGEAPRRRKIKDEYFGSIGSTTKHGIDDHSSTEGQLRVTHSLPKRKFK